MRATDSLMPDASAVYQSFRINDSVYYQYKRPKKFGFLTGVPGDIVDFAKAPFRKENLKGTAIVLASTAVLLLLDQKITNELQSFFARNGISPDEKNRTLWSVKLGGKETVLAKLPSNINTAFYNLGQGAPSLFLAAGLYVSGKISKNNRSLQVASQLTESFIAMGIITQVMKRISGRENPTDATVSGGRWRPFPSISNYQNQQSKYDAFPSGHLATMMATITVLAENYPELKWIKPVGYTLTGLVGLSMINNGVHWASDYPAGMAVGYLFGKVIASKNHHKLLLRP